MQIQEESESLVSLSEHCVELSDELRALSPGHPALSFISSTDITEEVVGILGDRGSGKTTTINRLLTVSRDEKCKLLPTGKTASTPAAITQIRPWTRKNEYRVVVSFLDWNIGTHLWRRCKA